MPHYRCSGIVPVVSIRTITHKDNAMNEEQLAELIYDGIGSARFQRWYAGKFEDHIQDSSDPKDAILKEIALIFRLKEVAK
jgi:hypothetical protein